MDDNPINRQQTKVLSEKICVIKLIIFDFDGVFTDNKVYVFEDGREAVSCNRQDGLGLRMLDAIGMDYFILSTEVNPVVQARAKKLKINCVNACEDKLAYLNKYLKNHDLRWQQVAFVGNDINDLGCLQAVGLPIVVADAHHRVHASAGYVTKQAGGYGAVREVCELFYDNHSGRSQ